MTIPQQEFGIFPNIPNEEYHSLASYISRSYLMDFDKSPYTYWAKHINPERPRKEPTPSMIMGSAFHKMILEPNTFQDEFVVLPEAVLLKNVGPERYTAYKKALSEVENTVKTIIPFAMHQELNAMRLTFLKNDKACELIKDAMIEHSIFWQDEHSGLLLKSRPDILHSNVIIDLKTTSDASPRAFQHEMVKYGYHIQFAMIRDGIEKTQGTLINNFINIVIENKFPYNMAIYMMDEFAIEAAHIKYKQLCLDLKECILQDKFQDYGIQTISLPSWAT